jgi:hypothetical protein
MGIGWLDSAILFYSPISGPHQKDRISSAHSIYHHSITWRLINAAVSDLCTSRVYLRFGDFTGGTPDRR